MKILVCTDFSAAAAAGEHEAARRFPGASLVVFHAANAAWMRRLAAQTGFDAGHLEEDVLSHADRRLSEVVRRLTNEGHAAIAALATGDPVALALKAAQSHGVELIVIGVQKDDPSGTFRTRIARYAHVPVLMIPASE